MIPRASDLNRQIHIQSRHCKTLQYPFHAPGLFLYPLKNLQFSGISEDIEGNIGLKWVNVLNVLKISNFRMYIYIYIYISSVTILCMFYKLIYLRFIHYIYVLYTLIQIFELMITSSGVFKISVKIW